MKARISIITLGIDDLKASLAFYRDGLGLETNGIVGKSLSKDSGLPVGQPSATELSIGHNVISKDEVDAVMEQARRAGAVIVKEPQDSFWGGYAGYFQDPTSICGKWRGIRKCCQPIEARLHFSSGGHIDMTVENSAGGILRCV